MICPGISLRWAFVPRSRPQLTAPEVVQSVSGPSVLPVGRCRQATAAETKLHWPVALSGGKLG